MNIKVGSYSVNGEFKSKSAAKKVFLEHFHAVTEKDLDTELAKLFQDADKSENVTEKVAESNTSDTKVGEKGVGEKQSGRNKPI